MFTRWSRCSLAMLVLTALTFLLAYLFSPYPQRHDEGIIWISRLEFEIAMVQLSSVPGWEKIPNTHLRPHVSWNQMTVPVDQAAYRMYLDVIDKNGR